MTDCPFCRIAAERIFHVDDLIVGLWDGFPVSPGHALLVPKRHVATWFDATKEERAALLDAIDVARAAIEAKHSPDGFNLGVNIGAAAGQTVGHLHLHVIPRFEGDVPDPRGGVRFVIPAQANYLVPKPTPAARTLGPTDDVPDILGLDDVPHTRDLVHGDEDGLLPHLLGHLDAADRVDLAVAFLLPGGVNELYDRFTDLLSRGGQLRVLTGDYLDATDPDALRRLLDLVDRADLPGSVELRVFETKEQSFHPKTYIFSNAAGEGIGFVGSSNLTRTALLLGIEWNYRVVSTRSPGAFNELQQQYERLFRHEATLSLDEAWIDAYQKRRRTSSYLPHRDLAGAIHETSSEGQQELLIPPEETIAGAEEDPAAPPEPWLVQEEALAALEQTRLEGNGAGLVVLATGLGKTWLAAFDAMGGDFKRVLFIAHREEILEQARKTFRRVAPDASLGMYTGQEKAPHARIIFASIQTLHRRRNLERFAPDTFDYIVVDEFHHASAATYRRVIDYFHPQFLLGLTATPERTDGGDILALCDENLVYRCDLDRGIELDLLVPFHYYGVPDTIDYSNIPWRSSRFDEEELTRAAATQERARNALEQYRKHGATRTIGFCVSIRHADFMAEYFLAEGVRAVSVHSGPGAAPRTRSLEQLSDGELDIIFAVDIFNEGVDVPAVDTVLMLRPTESRILWLQQLGRGLRLSEGKTHLTVIDYIGNHRVFLIKIQALLSLGTSHREIAAALRDLEDGLRELPPGCEVTYELEAKNILQNLLRIPKGEQAVQSFVDLYEELHGRRPSALEAYHEQFNPRELRRSAGSWFLFLASIGRLSVNEQRILETDEARRFLDHLETTRMTKSYKMILLQALMASDRLPGEQPVQELLHAFRERARRSSRLTEDVGKAMADDRALQKHLEKNPIQAWIRGDDTDDRYFSYKDGVFRSEFEVPADLRKTFQSMSREIVDWRLAEYLDRHNADQDRGVFRLRVGRNDRHPIILLDREHNAGLPSGSTSAEIGGKSSELIFAEFAVDVARPLDEARNALPDILESWFGVDAGSSETNHFVFLEKTEAGWTLRPDPSGKTGPELWKSYMREDIPPLFGLPFQQSRWRQGFVSVPDHLFLLVTLEKKALHKDHRYEDRFLDPQTFQWQSQNRTTQSGKHGRQIRDPKAHGLTAHLLVRHEKLRNGKAAPFVYCGPLEFLDWEGERPITVKWRLQRPLPGALWSEWSGD